MNTFRICVNYKSEHVHFYGRATVSRFARPRGTTMAGLRERQRRAREDRILHEAMRLFASEGFEGTRMERVADAADVSVGTLYNYHQNKHDLLGALVRREVETVLESGRALVAAPPADLKDALDALVGNYAGHGLEELTREMWRTAMGHTIAAPQSAFAVAFATLDDAIVKQITAALDTMKSRGMVRPNVDVERTGRLLFDIMDRRFVHHVTSEDEPAEAMHADLSHATTLLARAIGADGARAANDPPRTREAPADGPPVPAEAG